MSSPLDVSPWFGWLMKAFGDLSLFLWSVQPSPNSFPSSDKIMLAVALLLYSHSLSWRFLSCFVNNLIFKYAVFKLFYSSKRLIPLILSLKIQKPRTHEKSCSATNLFGLSVGLTEQSCSTVMCFLQLHDVLISQALSHMASRAVGGRWWSDPEQTKWVPALLLRPSLWAS